MKKFECIIFRYDNIDAFHEWLEGAEKRMRPINSGDIEILGSLLAKCTHFRNKEKCQLLLKEIMEEYCAHI